MQEIRVRSFAELHTAFQSYRGDFAWMFRGQRDPKWPLIPKAGRSAFFAQNEKSFFEAWKRRAVEYISPLPPNDWEWMAVAQQHGFSTRLLDWSGQPLVACFFAVDEHTSGDAVLYAHRPKLTVNLIGTSPFDPTPFIVEYRPSAFAARISRQGGRFTVHRPSTADLLKHPENGLLHKIIIDEDYVAALRKELDHYGVNYASIYPDLDGVSRHLNWIAAQRDLRDQLLI